MSFWQPDYFEKKRPYLEKRMRLIQSVRRFFDENGFLEVETPALQFSPGMEPHLKAFRTEILSANQMETRTLYLHTSPEFAMKKLLVAGLPAIYQICKVYRNAEGSPQHSAEFTMIEWYRAHADYRDIMDDCVALLRQCARDLGIAHYAGRDGTIADPFIDWEIITVADAFTKYAGIDLVSVLNDLNGFMVAARASGIRCDDGDSWDDIFFRVSMEKIEPNLGQGRPSIMYDYPVCMAALSRPKADDPRFAERFEIYVCGLELANAFGELTDSVIQKKRFEADMDLKQQLYGECYPIDPDFIAALEYGMPDAGGIALGIDRLVMLATGADDIDQVLWCGRP